MKVNVTNWIYQNQLFTHFLTTSLYMFPTRKLLCYPPCLRFFGVSRQFQYRYIAIFSKQ